MPIADIPIEQPTQYELAVNLRVVESLGLRLPPDLLDEARRIIYGPEASQSVPRLDDTAGVGDLTQIV